MTPALFDKRPHPAWTRKWTHHPYRPMSGEPDDTGRYHVADDTFGRGQFGPEDAVHRGAVAQYGQFRHGFAMPGYMARESDEFPNIGPPQKSTGRRTTILPSMGAFEDDSPLLLYDPMERRQRFGSRYYAQMRPSGMGGMGDADPAAQSSLVREFDAAWSQTPAAWRQDFRKLLDVDTCSASKNPHRAAALIAYLDHLRRGRAPGGPAAFVARLRAYSPRQAASLVERSVAQSADLAHPVCSLWERTMSLSGIGDDADRPGPLPVWAIPVGLGVAALLAWKFFRKSKPPDALSLENPRRRRRPR